MPMVLQVYMAWSSENTASQEESDNARLFDQNDQL